MIPRFSNPYNLQTSTKLASRVDLIDPDWEGDAKVDPTHKDVSLLRKRLRKLVRDDLGDFAFLSAEDQPRRKRRKMEQSSTDVGQEALIPFRLVSNSLALHKISLLPKPPPPVRSIEPEYEDNEVQAEQRFERAKSIAVDSDWVLQESDKSYPLPPNHQKKMLHAVTTSQLSNQPLALLIVASPRSFRNTRPAVPAPPSVASLSGSQTLATRSDCPKIPIEISCDSTTRPHRVRSRRQRRKPVSKERPQPTFWRPDPAVRGKSLGYAWGYPGNWAAHNWEKRRYERDTMRKGVYEDVLST